jgi:hypothetical protein
MKNSQNAEKTPPRSEGARLLRNAGTIAEIAAQSGLSTRSVSSFRSSSATPGDDARRKIASAYPHITPALWDRPPETNREPPWLSDAIGMLVDFPAAAAALRREVIKASGNVDALEDHDALEAELRAGRYAGTAELEAAAVAAEAAYAAALDGLDGPRVPA